MGRPGTVAESNIPSPERIAELVRSLANVMRQSSVTELDLDLGPMTLRLRRPVAVMSGESNDGEQSGSLGPASVTPAEVFITAPMIGTFYSSPTPGTTPFVGEGDEVYVGQTIGIIEAMKIMNEIAADRSGVVEAILAENGQPVEYGSPLMRLGVVRSDRS